MHINMQIVGSVHVHAMSCDWMIQGPFNASNPTLHQMRHCQSHQTSINIAKASAFQHLPFSVCQHTAFARSYHGQLDKLLPVSILDSICDGCVRCLSYVRISYTSCDMCLFEFGQGKQRAMEKASTITASLACHGASRSRHSY